jgi:Fe-S-cluster-containing hydrogenase component 2
MSEILPHTRSLNRDYNLREFKDSSTPVRVDYGTGNQRPLISLSNSTSGLATCLGCFDAPCQKINPSELRLPASINEFSGDPNLNACPTDAIDWDENLEFVSVNHHTCIGCGICISRCPYGAISFDDKATAVVHTDDVDNLTKRFIGVKTADSNLLYIEKIGHSCSGTEKFLKELPEIISHSNEQDVLIFVRNLLLQIGIVSRVRRKGDTNSRIDAIGVLPDGRIAAIEIETSNAVIESPRALLEDIAVIHSRYGIPKSEIDALSVILSLPNNRSEYYQVIEDVEKVLGITFRTLTIAIIILLVWDFRRITTFKSDLFSTVKCLDLVKSTQEYIDKNFTHSSPYQGAFQPFK